MKVNSLHSIFKIQILCLLKNLGHSIFTQLSKEMSTKLWEGLLLKTPLLVQDINTNTLTLILFQMQVLIFGRILTQMSC